MKNILKILVCIDLKSYILLGNGNKVTLKTFKLRNRPVVVWRRLPQDRDANESAGTRLRYDTALLLQSSRTLHLQAEKCRN